MGYRQLMWTILLFSLLINECYGQTKTNSKASKARTGGGKVSPFGSGAPTARCTIPKAPTDGKISCKRVLQELKCTGECKTGFQFPDGTTATLITCNNGVFTPSKEFPNCEEITSPQQATTQPPSKASKSNMPGTKGGKTSKTTEGGGNKSPFGQTSGATSCVAPNHPVNGRIQCKSSLKEQMCTGFCNDGFQYPDGATVKDITCSNGVYSPASNFPPCEAIYICGQPLSPRYGKVICQTSPSNEKTCTGQCREGYQFPDNTNIKEIVCRKGKFTPSDNFPDCEPMHKCKDPNAPRYGKISCKTLPTNDLVCTAECRSGYRFPDYSTTQRIECINGVFYPSAIPPCEAMYTCNDPNPPANGKMMCQTLPSSDRKCTGECSDGFKFADGTQTKDAICTQGVYSPSYFPDCQPMYKCDMPTSPMNGRVTCRTSATNDKTCTGQCIEGYQFPDGAQTKELTCIKGVYTQGSTFPNCQPIEPHPLSPEAGEHVSPGGGGGEHEPLVNNKCEVPFTPRNGKKTCRTSKLSLDCTGECLHGYQFPDKMTSKQVQCVNGVYTSDSNFPNCEPICDPPCENGGTCVGKDTCLCKKDYWGKLCDTLTSVCDLQATHDVGYQCKVQQENMTCVLVCPEGMKFEFQPESSYQCTPAGKWSPPEIPNCILNEMTNHNHDYNTRIENGKGSTSPPGTATSEHAGGIHFVEPPGQSGLIAHTISKLNGRCVTWEKKHFQSFDGRMYSFDGSCTYLLSKDCNDNTYSIYMDMSDNCEKKPCPITLHIYIEKMQFNFKNVNEKPSLYVDGVEIPIPLTINNIIVEHISHYIAVSSNLGFRLLWDGQNLVQIDVSPQSKNKTCGLCGRYDDNPLNDMETFNGIQTDDVVTFANSWVIPEIGGACEDTQPAKDTCYNLPQSVIEDAKRHCRRIKHKDYEDCLYLLDPAPYIDACISEYCSCYDTPEDCGCTSHSVFFKECARVLGKQSYEWRKHDFCNITCANDMIYQDCGSDCPATCANPNQKCKSDWCNDGCFCPQGKVLGPDNKCFEPSNCPCVYQNQYYPTGTSVQQDCNICKCFGGQWHCGKEVCAARCSSVGDPHYTTFDGKHYNFMGKCSYYLISNTNYSIEQEFVACDEALTKTKGMNALDEVLRPSCTKTITIRTHGSELHLKEDYSMVLNSRELLELPYYASGMYIYRPSSSFIKIELMNGLSVQWDGRSRLYMDAPPSLLNTLKGLCGTFSLSQKDDFLTPEGDVESNVVSFANKWKTDDFCSDMPPAVTPTDPCSVNPRFGDQAQSLCSQIKSTAFAACHDVVDPEMYVTNCMYDVCACKNPEMEDCFCSSIAHYAAECAKKGAIVEWRRQVSQCPITCPNGQVYSQCGLSCSRSCKDISSNPKCIDQCVEGCNCPLGLTLNSEGTCVPISECTCVFNDEEYSAGESAIRDGKMCTCVKAVWECRDASPEELRAAEIESKSSCPDEDNMEPTDCEVECPLTCSNFNKPPICVTVHCKPGCSCKDGYVYDTKADKCVQPSQCPCHHNERTYNPGETMLQDCNLCLCEGGHWKCEQRECPGICSAWGDTHISTFDGRLFDFVGACDYTLVQGSVDSNLQFTVNVQSVPCSDTDVTCIKSATLILGDQQLKLSKDDPLPEPDMNSKFIVRKVGLFLVVHTNIGVTLYWDQGTRIYVKLQSQWKNSVHGLCGDFNGNEMDDFQPPSGGPTIARATEFTDSWKVRPYCPNAEAAQDNCKLNPQREAWAQKKCGVLKSELFSSCHSFVPVEPFLERCVSDTCGCDIGGDCECTCTAIAAYAQECSVVDKEIEWRSQELCPIQCRDCDKYTPCMSVCPKKTCQTEFLYQEIDDSCKDEMCVEGCDPPVCKADEIYKDDKEFVCIPKDECDWQPCKIINGKQYHEGERITDESIALPCQSCHCVQGKINCVGAPCALRELSTPEPSTLPPPDCTYESHWSQWINNYKPSYGNKGDYEIVKDLIGPYQLCPMEYITAIECRDAVSHQLSSMTNNIVHCNLPTGLMCENELQVPDPICLDYEIRVFCDCDKNLPTTVGAPKTTPPPVSCLVPGWTVWMKDEDGNSDISSLRKQFSFCDNDEIVGYECREVDTKKLASEFDHIVCDKSGATCNIADQTDCPLMEVRYNCKCEKAECNAHLGMENGNIKDEQITASSYLTDNLEGKGARLNGRRHWSPELISNDQWIQVEFEEELEVVGIITQGSPISKEWITHYEVEYSSDGVNWEPIMEEGQPKVFVGNTDPKSLKENRFPVPIFTRYVKILPTDWIHRISLRFELLGCNRREALLVELTTEAPRIPPPMECVQTGWTKWISLDKPDATNDYEVTNNIFGDYETLSELRKRVSFCENPSAIRCQTVSGKISSFKTKQKLECNVNTGFRCNNADQPDGECLDYEVSFYCDCGGSTPYVIMSPTTPSLCTTDQPQGFTDWMSVGNPVTDPAGDIETIEELRSSYEFCKSEFITKIECRTVDSRLDYTQSGQNNLVCDPVKGFQCLHSEQTDFCFDYQVRFYCLCLEDVITTTEATEPTEYVKPETVITTVATETAGTLCAKWTDWINLSPPYASVEKELVADIPGFSAVCPLPIDIQCRQAGSGMDYSEFSYLKLDPDCTLDGIRCDNTQNDDKCPDFEIRVFCECYPPSTTPLPPGKLQPLCTSGWTDWYDIDNPESGGGDFERIEDLRKHYQFCSNDEIVDVKCEPVEEYYGEGGIDFRSTATKDQETKCTKTLGFECFNTLQTSGMCRDHRISLHCNCKEETLPTYTTPYMTVPTVAPICNQWTEWYDNDSPDEDGIEHELFENVKNFDQLCPIVERVECVDTYSDVAYPEYECSDKGIKCEDDDCPDFKIRAHCACEGVTEPPEVCVDGWTDWFNIDDPDSTGGDFENITEIRKRYDFCNFDHITEVECQTTDGTAYNDSGDGGVKCNKHIGASCNNDFQFGDKKCHDYKIRFNCQCGPTSPTSPPLPPLPPPVPTPTKRCPDGYTWYDCAYNCDNVCHSFLAEAHKNGECEDSKCIPACLKTECKSPKVWRDKDTCVMKSECNCLTEDDRMLGPGEVIEIDECERCQCLDNSLSCISKSGCGETTPAESYFTRLPILQSDCWTSWINDNTADKYGDSELIKDARLKYEFCDNPIKIECRTSGSKIYSRFTNEEVTCDIAKGLQCKNNVGVKGKFCSDYEIRFYCPCENVTTPKYTLPTTTPSVQVGPCVQGFTDWFSAHYPDRVGEHEQVSDIRQQGNVFCANEYLTSIQCREKSTHVMYTESNNHGLVCNLQQGFYCKNIDQNEGDYCDDFEVRYLCDCPTTAPPIVRTRTTTEQTMSTTSLALVTTVGVPACEYWSRWINNDNPTTDEGDIEKTTAAFLKRQENFCKEGEITDIECVDAVNGKNYKGTGDYDVICNQAFGLTCMNEEQANGKCRDYKIRYYCSCENVTVTTATSTPHLIVTPSIKPITVSPCTEFYPILPTVPDSHFKASSSLTPLTGPNKARLDSDGAWTAKLKNKDQFLEVDLGSNQPLYGVITAGSPSAQEWVTRFRISYSRDGVTYHPYMKLNRKTPYNFAGPILSTEVKEEKFDQPFEARFIRFEPKAWNGQISMRVDLLGCGKMTTTTAIPRTTVKECDEPMGLENQKMEDNQITVSSYRDHSQNPSRIRLNTPEDQYGAGGWSAASLDTEQFVQIDFRESRVLTGVETQGRENAEQYVSSYTVQYSNDGVTWYDVLDDKGITQIFNGNVDSDTPQVNHFAQPIRARYIKIKPITWHNWISMRLEILGCYEPYPPATEEIYEYTATTPTLRPEYTASIGYAEEEEEETNELNCSLPMGFENGKIDPSQITVSSSLLGDHSGVTRLGLNTPEEEDTGGWLAKDINKEQYIEVDFKEPTPISAITTQGRAKHNEWVETYKVTYSDDGQTWKTALVNKQEIIIGNSDGLTPVTREFDTMISARYFRIHPLTWHSWIAMRLELLGCYTGEKVTVVPKVECEEYGDWVNINRPQYADGDYEPMDEVIRYSNYCTNPIEIECRESISKIDFSQTGQKVQCDLTNGLICKNYDQGEGQYCYDYEVRIVCYTCPGVTEQPLALVICPEVPVSLAKNCPKYCPVGQLCDGSSCVTSLQCPCYMDGKKFLPGDRLQTADCRECECELDGFTTCRNKTCPPCAAGLKEKRGKDCKCSCEPCPLGEKMCEMSKECVSRKSWCDGVVDCPNREDEENCPTPTPPPTCPPTPVCPQGTVITSKNTFDRCPIYECELVAVPTTTPKPQIPLTDSCDIYGNYFKTFDDEEFPYDICDHTLMQDKTEHKFSVTMHKECDEKTNQCTKYIQIKQDQHEIRLDSDLSVEYNDQIYKSTQLTRLSQSVKDFTLRTVANTIIFRSNVYNFEVEWNTQQNVKIKVGEHLLYQINGLCGLYSKNSQDDFETPSGERASSVENFGNSWAIGSMDRCKPEVCTAPVKMQAMAICNNLILPPLDACNKIVDAKFHMSACVASICECLSQEKKKPKECECDAYLPYVEACKKQDSTVKINEWRTKLGCSPQCPPGLIWKDCGPICERSCDNLQADLSECEDSCVAGCYCPDGTVKKRENVCVTPDKCQDCVCDGYGDPHYTTFDRFYYPYQGNCTYVLARDKSATGQHKFEVYITNDECYEEPGTTCTTAIMVIYNGHIAHFRINQTVMLDGVGLYPSDFPMEYEGINITTTSAPDRTITFRIDEINLEVRYFENNYGFQVRLPSDIYYNNLEGLCGDCNFDKWDDTRRKDGVFTNDTNEFGLSWLAEPPEGMEAVDTNCIVFEEKPCENNLEKERCESVLGPQFKACHLLVDPQTVLQSCQFDVCHSINPEESLCRSLTEYARACAQLGVCINWRTDTICPIKCDEGMYFDQCGSACMRTCKNKDEYVEEGQCEVDTVEGCFCIGDRVLKDGVCVDAKECEVCDKEGHEIGETWKTDPCTSCECTDDLTIECTKTQCPSKPICKNDEILLSIPRNSETCCDEFYCEQKPKKICPEISVPSCAPGEVTKAERGDDACPEFSCVCDPTECPRMREPILTEQGQEVVVDNTSCCPIKKVICNKQKCPADPRCKKGEQLETYNENKCCPEKHCVPPRDQCYYSHLYDKTSDNAVVKYNDKEALYEPGSSWFDGTCTKCACDGSPGHYNAHCQKEVCPDLDPAVKKNYVVKEMYPDGKCCPKIKQIMCLLDGIKFPIGESLPSPDGDFCKKIECVQAPNGDAIKATISRTCTLDCPKGFEYEPADSTSKECCGKCKPIACIEEKNIYEVGDKWKSTLNKCAMAVCVNDSSVGVITHYETTCSPLPENCPKDKITRDAEDCCDICSVVPPTEGCVAKTIDVKETVKIFSAIINGRECVNKQPIIGMQQCLGKCDSHTTYSSSGKFESTCLCCTPDHTVTKRLELDCSDGTKSPFTYEEPLSCSCSVCSNTESQVKVPPAV